MNKELLTKFQLQAGGSHYPGINPQIQEKFARLIVRECMDIVNDAVDRREPASTYVGKIKEHFGIEE